MKIYTYFLNYILLIMLLLLTQFSPVSSLHPTPSTASGNPHTIVHVHAQEYKFFGFSIPYTVLYIPMAVL